MKIYKYPLAVDGYQTIRVPYGAQFLSVQFQREQLCLWALVDEEAHLVDRRIEIIGTGNPMPDTHRAYIGTVQETRLPLVWHVFEVLA